MGARRLFAILDTLQEKKLARAVAVLIAPDATSLQSPNWDLPTCRPTRRQANFEQGGRNAPYEALRATRRGARTTVIMEKNRMQFIHEVESFLEEPAYRRR